MDKKSLEAVALSVRSLSIDAIQKANSGHPGLPLGCAELAAVLYGEVLKHNPENSSWIDRDRFVLSAGHGSMLLYSILHLAGYKISLNDIRNFRQVGSPCAGHPEYGVTDGIEITTGPLGQGIAGAVGMAIAETMLAAHFNTPDYSVINHYTYALAGEGCLMEGVSSEASSLAGHLKLSKLVIFYDDNRITIDGSVDLAFTEDIGKRYEAYGWQVLKGSMYNIENTISLIAEAKSDPRPTLIILKSCIGYGAPTVEGTSKAHGAALGVEGVIEAKKKLGLDPEKFFYIDPLAEAYFNNRKTVFAEKNNEWNILFAQWSEKYPEKKVKWDKFFSNTPYSGEISFPDYKINDSIATRTASEAVLNAIARVYPQLVGGSADLQGPNAVLLKDTADYSSVNRSGRYIRYGVREFAMAAISNGLQVHGGLRSFCATFMVFSDYLRPALRLSALMKLPVIYVFTHDSIYVGEDGPTHQPIETLAALRAIPDLLVLRPGDAEETCIAWKMALRHIDGPVCLALTRQNISVYEKADPDWKNTIECGAYIVQKGSDNPDVTILASGSEVSLTLRASALVPQKKIRVISVLSRELLTSQSKIIKNVLFGNAKRVIVAEAGISQGWEGFVLSSDDIFCIHSFGASGPSEEVAKSLGFIVENLAKLINK